MRTLSISLLFVFLVMLGISSVASAQTLGTFRWQLQPFCNIVTLAITQNGGVFRLEGTDDQHGAGDAVALRAIEALEARTRAQHAHMLEDTQSLADESGSLVQENADRIAEIAALKVEIAALRAEVVALREARRR